MIRTLSCCLLLSTLPLGADTVTFDSPEEWSECTQPQGLLNISENGQLSLTKFRKNTNLIVDAHLFTHDSKTRGDAVAGGVWEAGSNPGAVL